MTERDPVDLRWQATRVLGTLRGLMNASTNLERCTSEGRRVMTDVEDVDKATVFAVYARRLVEFFWRDRTGPRGIRDDDVVATAWFPDGVWVGRPSSELPEAVRDVRLHTGKGIAHLSYRAPLMDDKGWWWDHVAITRASFSSSSAGPPTPTQI